MAINQENVALDIASQLVATAGNLINAVEEFTDLLAWALDAGINMTDHDAALEASGELQHVDGATINRLATLIPALNTHLDTNTIATLTSREWLQKIRRS